MKRLSEPFDNLIGRRQPGKELLRTDVLIIGSGYGGAVAAMRLAGARRQGQDEPMQVVVLERGREYGLGDFPYDIADIPSHIRVAGMNVAGAGGYDDALFTLYPGMGEASASADESGAPADLQASVDVLVGSGLGGTSLINANVAEEPLPHVFKKPAWPEQFREAHAPLQEEFQWVRKFLGVKAPEDSGSPSFAKYRAMEKLCGTLEGELKAAQIAVTREEGANAVGVEQHACTDCGNCVTGCNVGAKNTLDRNLLRLAAHRGATFYTGATVKYLERDSDENHPWLVHVQPTVQMAGQTRPESYRVYAGTVILAAGTLGSTEILLQSRKEKGLSLSARLGDRFSTNGDGIVMSFGQKQQVRAVAEPEQKAPRKKVGPTITGIYRNRSLTLEDASIPAPLARLFAETVTSSAMIQRLADRELPLLHRQFGLDPLAASRTVTDHCQTFLVMGEDGARGKISLREKADGLHIACPDPAQFQSLQSANELIREQDRQEGLDGGQYAPNPLWELMPKEAAGVMSGELPRSRAITVHPLGGCAMADSVAGGVVNHKSQVFDAEGEVHQGLYVMDGAVIPAALEVNPFLTIAALAWRNCEPLLKELTSAPSRKFKVTGAYKRLGPVPDRPPAPAAATHFKISEQLYGRLETLPSAIEATLPDQQDRDRLAEQEGLVVAVEAHCDNGERFLDDPGNTALQADMYLSVNPLSEQQVETYRPDGVHAAHIETHEPFMHLKGTFTIFAEDDYNWLSDRVGGLRAVAAYVRRRGSAGLSSGGGLDFKRMWREFKVFFNIGVMQSRFRRLKYEFTDERSGLMARGVKTLGYSDELQRMWPELLHLDLEFRQKNPLSGPLGKFADWLKGPPAKARLKVNVQRLLNPGLLQVEQSAHLPQSLSMAGGLAAFFVRTLFATNFWEFAGVNYPKRRQQKTLPTPLTVSDGEPVEPEFIPLTVPIWDDPNTTAQVELLLTRYPRKKAQPILLIHGLAQGSQIFWTAGIHNMARYFYEHGYDVWMLDYRLSNHVLEHMQNRDWTMDEIARIDIPAAINRVYDITQKSMFIVAHCVGASSMAMAVLEDHVRQPSDQIHQKIKGSVTNAIHPFVMMSRSNRFRARLASFLSMDIMPADLLDPIPSADDSALHNFFDRVAHGLARVADDITEDHIHYPAQKRGAEICDRMSFLYGRMWNHCNIDVSTHDAFADMLGPAPLKVYSHLYYYSQLNRLTNSSGENVYLRRDNIEKFWTFPSLFVHGRDSRVFNPHSARRSAKRLTDNMLPGSGGLAKYKVYPRYGHMDPIFGKHAHKRCFEDYRAFLEDPCGFSQQPAVDIGDANPASPVVGPILRAAWREGDVIRLRFWAELRSNRTVLANQLQVRGDATFVHDEGVKAPYARGGRKNRYRYIDLDLDLLGGGGRYASDRIGQDPKATIELYGHAQGGSETGGGVQLTFQHQGWLRRLTRDDCSGDARMCFLVGSCRFPGSLVDNALSDKIYACMEKCISGEDSADLLFLIGDQIYADASDQLYETKSLRERYTARYRRAFSEDFSPRFANLVRNVPTHFAIDDHEIDDNWSGLPAIPDLEDVRQAEFALKKAAHFMGSTRSQRSVGGHKVGSQFYYPLAHAKECEFPVFVTDTRSERQFRGCNDPGQYALMSQAQFSALTKWLVEAHQTHPNEPKFIISGSVVTPLPRRYVDTPDTWRRLDGWAGYPATLEKLLVLIVKEGIQKVVLVGGDAHISAYCSLDLTMPEVRNQATRVHQVVSSGLYAPLPFANSKPGDFEWEKPYELPVHLEHTLNIRCTNHLLSSEHAQFLQIDATATRLSITCHSRDKPPTHPSPVML